MFRHIVISLDSQYIRSRYLLHKHTYSHILTQSHTHIYSIGLRSIHPVRSKITKFVSCYCVLRVYLYRLIPSIVKSVSLSILRIIARYWHIGLTPATLIIQLHKLPIPISFIRSVSRRRYFFDY